MSVKRLPLVMGILVGIGLVVLVVSVACVRPNGPTPRPPSVTLPVITTTFLPDGQVGVAYSQQLGAEGGTPPYTGAISAGALPPGLTFNSNTGVISGMPTAAGTSRFTVQITDSAGNWSTTTLSINIIDFTPPVFPITFDPPAILRPATVDQPYNFDFASETNLSGGNPPYTFYLGSGVGFPPFGLVLDLNGLLSGIPSIEGTRTFEVCVKDLDGNQKCGMTQLTVNPVPTPTNEVFQGTFSGVFGNAGSSIGCKWSYSFSGTMTLTLVQNSDGTISGTAQCPTDISIPVIYNPPDATCNEGAFSETAAGQVSGTNASLGGTFVSAAARPLQIVFAGARSDNTITGSITISKQFQTTVNGEVESRPSFSTTINNIVLTRQQ